MVPEFFVPTLSEWGMVAMVAVLGIVGVLALRKRLASAGSSR
jgi:IPTL-CTERM motif